MSAPGELEAAALALVAAWRRLVAALDGPPAPAPSPPEASPAGGAGRRPVTYPIPPAAPAAHCRSCGAVIYWSKTRNDKSIPVNPDGVAHFSTCPHATEHRGPRA